MRKFAQKKSLLVLSVFALIAILAITLIACDDNKTQNNPNETIPPKNCANELSHFNLSEDGTTVLGLKDEYKNATIVGIPFEISRIAENAFADCESITSIGFLSDIESIGANAFYNTGWYNAQPDGPVYLEKWLLDFKGEAANNGKIVIADETKGIADCAFYKNLDLTEITIPDSIRHIGQNAFGGCDNLTVATLPLNAVSYIPKENLQTVTVTSGNSYPALENEAFSGCEKLKTVNLPEDLFEIGAFAFIGCTALEEISIPDNVEIIGNGAFGSCSNLKTVKLPESLRTISDYTFNSCTSLKVIVIPDNVYAIGFRAFADCNNLINISMPSKLSRIGEGAFWNCSSITDLKIPDDVTIIGHSAFNGCNALENLTVGKNLKHFGGYLLFDCKNLKNITIPAVLAQINVLPRESLETVVINGGDTIERYAFYQCPNLKSVTVSDSVTTIKESAFEGCFNLESVSMQEGLKIIENNAFSFCNISRINFPRSLSFIGDYAFENCKFSEFKASESIRSIGNYAFRRCTELTSVTIAGENLFFGERVFDECENLTNASIPVAALKLLPAAKIKKIAITSGEAIFEKAFDKFRVLEDITICDQMKYVDERAFGDCNSVITATVPTVALVALPKKNLQTATVTYGYCIPQYAFMWAENLTQITISDDVSCIKADSFSHCYKLKSIVIPKNIESISAPAFLYCDALESITVDKENPRYYSSGNCVIDKESGRLVLGCKTSVIPADGSIKEIGSRAFSNCTGITRIDVPNGVEKIGYEAFWGCSDLKTVTLPESLYYIYDNAFGGSGLTEITVPSHVYYLGKEVFKFCTDLKKATIEVNLTRLPEGTFKYCEKLETVVLPNRVLYIDEFAFYACSSLTNLTLPESLEGIYENAFSDCWNLLSLTLPENLRYIGSGAFDYCKKLYEIYNKSSLEITAGDRNNGYVGYYAKQIFTADYVSKYVTTEDGYVLYCDGDERILMRYCGNKTDITLPTDITSINDCAFANCDTLESITLPEQITTISYAAFKDCYNLKTIRLSGNVTIIKGHAFSDCEKLTDVYFDGTKEQFRNTGYDYSLGTSNIVIHCTDGNMDKYCNDITE